MQRTDHVLSLNMVNHFTVSNKISWNVSELTLKCWKISGYQFLKTWQIVNFAIDPTTRTSANSNCFSFPFRVRVTVVLLNSILLFISLLLLFYVFLAKTLIINKGKVLTENIYRCIPCQRVALWRISLRICL